MYARMYPSTVMAGSEGLTWASSLASAGRACAAACRRDPGVTRAPGPRGTPTGLPFLQRCAPRLCCEDVNATLRHRVPVLTATEPSSCARKTRSSNYAMYRQRRAEFDMIGTFRIQNVRVLHWSERATPIPRPPRFFARCETGYNFLFP